MTKEYKVEGLIYYTKMTLDSKHILKSSTEDIQKLLDQYASEGWTLASTDTVSFGAAVYVYVYFER